jgi:predicted DNA-binding protein (UPF0251 family)
MADQHMTAWDHAAEAAKGAVQKIEVAAKAEVAVVKERVTPSAILEAATKIVEPVKQSGAVLERKVLSAAELVALFGPDKVEGKATDVLAAAEAEAEKLVDHEKIAAHEAATKIEAHAETLTGGLKHALTAFAAKLRSGEEKLVAEVKAELEKIGVKF